MRWLLIDCSRLTERHEWYLDLVDRLAEWGYDGLVLHFCDDESLAVALPGFEDLASPRALSLPTVAALLARAKARGIRVIPEIECFGHTRWLAPHPRWGSCWVGQKDLSFNAVDPTDPKSLEAMSALIDATCQVFDDPVVHIGCDEVELAPLAERLRGRDPALVWSDHVNALIGMVISKGRTPMLWGDHLEHSATVLERIDRRAEVVSWHYGPDDDASVEGMRRLRAAGFKAVWSAPAVACWSTRGHVHRPNLLNVSRMEAHARAEGCVGTIDTLWCPYRHVRDAQLHGIAAAALIHEHGTLEAADDGAAIARMLFGNGNAQAIRLCRDLPRLVCHNDLMWVVLHGKPHEPPDRHRLAMEMTRQTLTLGAELLPAVVGAAVESHGELLEAMLLSARLAIHFCRLGVDPGWRADASVVANHHQLLSELEADWLRTRFAEDPARTAAPREISRHHYLLAVMRQLDPQVAARATA